MAERVAAAGCQEVETHCPYCALQCGMVLRSDAPLALNAAAPAGRSPVPSSPAQLLPPDLERITVDARAFPSNRGAMCKKGFAAAELLRAPDRLLRPLIRRPGEQEHVECSWEEAIGFVVSRVRTIRSESGSDALAVFGGGGLTNETAYMLGKFARLVLGTRNIDYNGRFCMASAAVALNRAFGMDRGLPFPLADLSLAKVILAVGANPAETMPPLLQYFEEQRARHGALIVIDPRRTPTAELATLHLQNVPGTDVAVANGLLYLLAKHGYLDHAFIAEKTTGFSEVQRLVRQFWPDRVERISGVSARLLEQAAHLLGEASTVIGLSGKGIEQSSHGVDGVLSFINLLLALGQVGRRGSGFGCLTGQGNGQGGREHGQKADQLPGYRKIDDPGARRAVAAVWGVDPETLPGPGLAACELIEQMGQERGIRALFLLGSNLVVAAPGSGQTRARLQQLDLFVTCDSFLNDTNRLADVLLPVCHWAEHEGTLTNLEGRLLLRRQALPRPEGVWTDLEVLLAIASGLGAGHFIEADSERAFAELCRASAGGPADYSGLSYERIRESAELFWPCPSAAHPGTPRPLEDGFPLPGGRARFHAVDWVESLEQTDEQYPYWLTTGRVISHYQTGEQTRRVPSLLQAEPEPFVQVHPDLAASLGVARGDWLLVRSRRGSMALPVRISRAPRPEVVFVPIHWGGAAAVNQLTSSLVDPQSKIPEFKLSAVALERIPVDQIPRSPSRPN